MDPTLAQQGGNPVAVAIVGLFALMGLALLPVRRELALFVFVVSLPFIGMPILAGRIFQIPGVSIINIMLLLGIGLTVQALSEPERMPPGLRAVLVIYLILNIWSPIYGLFHWTGITKIPGFFRITEYDYLRDYLIRPLAVWAIFPIAIKYCGHRTNGHLHLLRIIAIGTILFGTTMLVATAYYYTKSHDLNVVRDDVFEFLGSHSNDFSTTFVLSALMFLAYLVYWKPSRLDRLLLIVATGVAVLGTLFSYSRSAYGALALIGAFFLFVGGKRGVALLVPAFLALVVLMPASVIERVHFGLGSGSGGQSGHINANDVSAGRLGMWSRAVDMITEDAGVTLVGEGRLIWPQKTFREFGPMHPHNGYLEILLDTGVVGLTIVLVMLAYIVSVFRRAKRHADRKSRGLYAAGVLCVVSYAIMAISGRSFYPDPASIPFWLTTGVFIGVAQRERISRRAAQRAAHLASVNPPQEKPLQEPRAVSQALRRGLR